MKMGELIPVPKHIVSKASVPAGKAARADFGTLGLSQTIGQPSGDTSKTTPQMPKYKTIPGMKQGTK